MKDRKRNKKIEREMKRQKEKSKDRKRNQKIERQMKRQKEK